MNSYITLFGKTDFRNAGTKFGIYQRDRLLHTYIVGKTGTGKSTMLKTMFIQDVLAERGGCLIDPHGDLVEAIFEAIPISRMKDVIYINVPDKALNLRYNPFRRVSFEKRSLVASSILDVFKKLWADAWGVKLEHILRHVILTLLDQPSATLADVPLILLDYGFRKKAIESVENVNVRCFGSGNFLITPVSICCLYSTR